MKSSLRRIVIFSSFTLFGTTLFNTNQITSLADDFLPVEERDIFETLENSKKQDTFLPASPMELMHKLQKSSAMDNATSPMDALDEALEIFYDQDVQNNSAINN